MTAKPLPSQELLRQLLRYEPETGRLFWRERPEEMFGTKRAFKIWNTRYSGKEAFNTLTLTGYKQGSIFDIKYLAHRIIWKMVYNQEPPQIDHIDHNPSDNRIHMLRASSNPENGKNQKHQINNTSGVMGVCWDKDRNKWRAQIQIKGKNKYLGIFTEFDKAVAARKAAEVKYGFCKNHGC